MLRSLRVLPLVAGASLLCAACGDPGAASGSLVKTMRSPKVPPKKIAPSTHTRALIGEDAKRPLIGEDAKRPLIGEDAKRPLIGEDAKRPLIGEDGKHLKPPGT